MNNTRPYGPLDEVDNLAGDRVFIGVDERWAPHELQPGYVSAARNKRFRRGRAETRPGIGLLPWSKGTGLTAFTDVLGGGIFQDPNQGGEWILIAAEGKVWKTRPNSPASQVPLPAGVTLTKDTFRKFIQCNGSIVLLRGLNADPLRCDTLGLGFQPIVQQNIWDVTFNHATSRVELVQHNLVIGDPVRFQGGTLPAAITADQTYWVADTPNADEFTVATTPGGTAVAFNDSPTDTAISVGTVTVLDGAQPIPPSEDGFFFSKRLYLIVGKDLIAQSDIGDFTRYQPIPSTFRINEGDSGTLRAIYPFNEDTLLCFKSNIVAKAVGLADLATAVGPLNVTQAYGVAGPRAIADHGADVYWLTSELRVSSLRLTELNKEQGTDAALSDALIQTFGRINRLYADQARMVTHRGFLFVALPLDDAEVLDDNGNVLFSGVNTGMAVYDFQAKAWNYETQLTGAWCGVDEADGLLNVIDFLKVHIDGQVRLCFLGADGFLHLLDEGFEDEQVSTITPYVDVLADVLASLGAGDTLQVNGGTIVTAGGNWNISTDPRTTLWTGYSTGGWTAPNTTATQIDYGVRFTATNGTLPIVKVNGVAIGDGYRDWAFVDFLPTPTVVAVPIADRVLTRAYLCDGPRAKRYTSAAVHLSGWAPNYTITTAGQGIGTENEYSKDEAPNRLKYRTPHDAKDFVPSNVNDDFGTAGREDYSVLLPDTGMSLGTGVALGLHQEFGHRVAINERGLWLQLDITNNQGRLELITTNLESQEGELVSGVFLN